MLDLCCPKWKSMNKSDLTLGSSRASVAQTVNLWREFALAQFNSVDKRERENRAQVCRRQTNLL
jgi:hypothetical protein